jgi:uncharacterized protein (TIGR02996 family)
MRTFTFTDDKSHKFWNIELQGNQFTVQFGRIGTAGQTQVKQFADEATARKEHDKLVAQKLKKGYVETTSTKAPASLREGLEAALVDNPDDLATHMAYADYLAEQGDPLGEFIRVQLALEDESKPADQRKMLQQQEERLLQAHQRTWLGELAPYLLGEDRGPSQYEEGHLQVKYTFARGWLHTLQAKNLFVEFTRALAKAPQLRLLRRLVLLENLFDEGASGDDLPEESNYPQLYPLARCPYLSNVRQFVLGEMIPLDEEVSVGGYLNCRTQGEGVVGVVKRMPKLKELYLLAHNCDTEQLFALQALHELRILMVYHEQSYPLARLAENPSLGKLTHLLCYPHTQTPFETEAYLRLDDVRALVRSPRLPSLTHLRLRLSDMGDEGAREIVESGILKRLRVLDLEHGCISDEGARILAACKDVKRLERLALTHNCLTEAGIHALQAAGVKLAADHQWQQSGDAGEDRAFLFMAGDME